MSQVAPLSIDFTILPEIPTATKVLLPYPTPKRVFEVGEVTLSKDDPLSIDLTMVPELPTATKQPLLQLTEEEKLSESVMVVVSSVVVLVLSVLVVLSLLVVLSVLLQDMIVRLKRNTEKMIGICLIIFLIG